MKDLRIGFFGVRSWERGPVERGIIKLPVFGIGIFEEEVQERIELAAKYDVISCSINADFSRKMLDKLPKLKLITARSNVIDHIDMAECKRRKIKVLNVTEYGARAVAEYTLALMLAVAKKIVVAHQSVEEGDFFPSGLTGIDLYSKTLGVVGVGRIGQKVIKYARAFGMKVLAVERKPEESLARKLGFKYTELETLLKNADFVSLHVPATKETFHLINRKNIKLMKEGSYLINTSRGPVVETEAIIWALNHKILAGAGLDVTEEEEKIESVSMVMSKRPTKDDLQEVLTFHMLRDRDDVIFTPHNAFNTKETVEGVVEEVIDKIKNVYYDNIHINKWKQKH